MDLSDRVLHGLIESTARREALKTQIAETEGQATRPEAISVLRRMREEYKKHTASVDSLLEKLVQADDAQWPYTADKGKARAPSSASGSHDHEDLAGTLATLRLDLKSIQDRQRTIIAPAAVESSSSAMDIDSAPTASIGDKRKASSSGVPAPTPSSTDSDKHRVRELADTVSEIEQRAQRMESDIRQWGVDASQKLDAQLAVLRAEHEAREAASVQRAAEHRKAFEALVVQGEEKRVSTDRMLEESRSGLDAEFARLDVEYRDVVARVNKVSCARMPLYPAVPN